MDKQQFQSILPCFFGQKLLTDDGKIGTIDIIYKLNDGSLEITCYNLVRADYKIGEFKLILRKIKDMTEEEDAIYQDIARSYFESDETLAKNMNERRAQINSRLTNYLRSIGVDTDNLIEAGWAIHQKEVKP